MKKKAVEYFKNGYSCSESIVKACVDEGLCDSMLLSCATSFSGGMTSGCLCGAVAASQMILGFNFGRENTKDNDVTARNKAKDFIEEFKTRHNVTCCRFLCGGLEGAQRKERCTVYVADACEILDELIKAKV